MIHFASFCSRRNRCEIVVQTLMSRFAYRNVSSKTTCQYVATFCSRHFSTFRHQFCSRHFRHVLSTLKKCKKRSVREKNISTQFWHLFVANMVETLTVTLWSTLSLVTATISFQQLLK